MEHEEQVTNVKEERNIQVKKKGETEQEIASAEQALEQYKACCKRTAAGLLHRYHACIYWQCGGNYQPVKKRRVLGFWRRLFFAGQP